MAKKVQLKGEMTWDNSRLKRGLAQSEQLVKNTAGRMKAGFGRAAGAAGFAAGAFGFKAVADEFDRIDKLSARFNVSVEALQRLGHAAKLSGGTLEQVAKAMNQLVMKTQEQGMAGEFAKLGLDIENLAKMSPEEMFMNFADAVSMADDENKAAAASFKILGEEAGELLPLLKAGSVGITQMTADLNVLGREGVTQLAKANDEMARMGQNMTVIGGQVGSFVAKGLTAAQNAGHFVIGHGVSLFSEDFGEAILEGSPAERKKRAEAQAERRRMQAFQTRARAMAASAVADEGARDRIRMPWERAPTRADQFMQDMGVSFGGLDAMVNLQKTSANFRGELNDPVFSRVGQGAAVNTHMVPVEMDTQTQLLTEISKNTKDVSDAL